MGLDRCSQCESIEGGWTEDVEANVKTCDQCGAEWNEAHENIPEHDDYDLER